MVATVHSWTAYQAIRALALVRAFNPRRVLEVDGSGNGLTRVLRLLGVDAQAGMGGGTTDLVLCMNTLSYMAEDRIPLFLQQLSSLCSDKLVMTFVPWVDFEGGLRQPETVRTTEWWHQQLSAAGFDALDGQAILPETLFPRHETIVAQRRERHSVPEAREVGLEGTADEYLELARHAMRGADVSLAENLISKAFSATAPESGDPIFVFSANPWDSLFQRQHQLALQFGEQHGTCLYFDPDYIRVTADVTLERDAELKAHFLWALLKTLKLVGPRTYVAKFVIEIASQSGSPARNTVVSFFEYLTQLAGGKRPRSVFYLPQQAGMAVALAGRSAIFYDCVDEFGGFSHSPASISFQEAKLLEHADAVFVTASALMESKRQTAAAIYLVPNGVDIEVFRGFREPSADVKGLPRPVVTFVGAIADWVDVDLVIEASRLRRDWSFVLVGPAFVDVTALAGEPNVRLLGKRPYSELPAVLQSSDAGIIPFKLNELTRNSDPIKCYEYLAAGLPVISTNLPQVRRFADRNLVKMVSTAKQLVEAIEAELGMLPDAREALHSVRQEAAAEESWRSRAKALLQIMEAQVRLLDKQWSEAAETFRAVSLEVQESPRLSFDRRVAAVLALLGDSSRLGQDINGLPVSSEAAMSQEERDLVHQLGIEWCEKGRVREATDLFAWVVSLSDDDEDGWINLASCLAQQARWQDALQALAHCPRRARTEPGCLSLLGGVLANLGFTSAAKRVLLSLEKRNEHVRLGLDVSTAMGLLASSPDVGNPPRWVDQLLTELDA